MMDGFDTRDPKGGVRTFPRRVPLARRRADSDQAGAQPRVERDCSLVRAGLGAVPRIGSDWILDAYLAELLDVRPRFADAEVLVAEHDGRVVGTIVVLADVRHEGWSNLPAGWTGFRALAVAPRMRGAGIGQALVQHCIQRTRHVGAETLGIHTISLLTDAVRLYQRLGFVRCPEFDLRAADVFPSENADEMVGLAFRRDAEKLNPAQV